jgi:pseudouridine-5'-phosphate glycosidase
MQLKSITVLHGVLRVGMQEPHLSLLAVEVAVEINPVA